MSSGLALAGVTRCLRSLLHGALQETLPLLPADMTATAEFKVTTLPLDRVRQVEASGNLLNLFLSSSVPNAAFRNAGAPEALALNLHYLLTAFGQDDNELIAQLMLGRALLALHDHALLSPAELADALADAGLQHQVERVRITPHAMGFDELSKLWMAFQTPYRISAAFEVSVVLIDSRRAARVAPPVRQAAIVVSPFKRPQIDEIRPQVLAAGATAVLKGSGLGDAQLQVRVAGRAASIGRASDTELSFTLPADLPAGVNTVQCVIEVPLGSPAVAHAGVGFQSNGMPFLLTPAITSPGPLSVARGAVLTLQVAPAVGASQRVLLMLDDLQLAAEALPPGTVSSSSVRFAIPADYAARSYLARVMVDGAASPLVTDTTAGSPTQGRYIAPTVSLT